MKGMRGQWIKLVNRWKWEGKSKTTIKKKHPVLYHIWKWLIWAFNQVQKVSFESEALKKRSLNLLLILSYTQTILVFYKTGDAATRAFWFDDLFCLSYVLGIVNVNLLQWMSNFLHWICTFYSECPTFNCECLTFYDECLN